ncbi:hypothetical protein PENTCL1PPCAC_19345, partial [Pristionchus entomophagus]
MARLLLLAALVGCTMAAVMQIKAKVGEKVELDLGEVKVWERSVNGTEQTIRLCSKTEKNVACSNWVDTDGNPVAKGAFVCTTGKLKIKKASLADSGSYSSPDVKPKFVKHEDGSMSATASPMISLTV